MESDDLVHRRHAAAELVDRKSPFPQRRQHLPMRRRFHALHVENVVDEQVERSLRGDLGIELAQRTGGGISWIGKRLLPGLEQPLVQLLEGRDPHNHLASDGEERRDATFPVPKHQRRGPNGAHVLRDPLPVLAVPPGGPPHQGPVLIDEFHRRPVELGLDHVRDPVPDRFPHALVEPAERGFLLRRVEAEHRDGVLHRGKLVERFPPHPLRR